jgi:hypothetical protein
MVGPFRDGRPGIAEPLLHFEAGDSPIDHDPHAGAHPDQRGGASDNGGSLQVDPTLGGEWGSGNGEQEQGQRCSGHRVLPDLGFGREMRLPGIVAQQGSVTGR